jgi:hypothetical protein
MGVEITEGDESVVSAEFWLDNTLMAADWLITLMGLSC